ncbi:MAG: type I DNA topoisomerase [Candidatus Eremiobacteraeota bacterium]|nr:type I DNA topoisomerase [Candidatus Eremiobacteraeota bacterium]
MADKGFIIVESPAKARTLQKYVGKEFTVKASMGHVIDLPKSRIGVDIEKNFTPRYVTIKGKEKIIKELRKEAHGAREVYLATDPDREGEAIAWHLSKALDLSGISRIALHEITPDALATALKSPGKIDIDKVNAQQARRILDRLVGYKLSPLLWKKVTSGLSAGRVQSVAVRLIVDRQREIDAFIKEEYWTIAAELGKKGEKTPFVAGLSKEAGKKIEIPNEERAMEIKGLLEGGTFVVAADPEKKKQKKEPPPPYITSTLQQDASRRLNFKVVKTMKVAQQLFEGLDIGDEGTVGLITYMRTDSTRIAESAREEAAEYIRSTFGEHYIGPRRTYKKSKGAQEAHECIRPTNIARDMSTLSRHLTPEQFRLYKLICDRFLASLMASCELEVKTVDIANGPFLLRAQGSAVTFPGFTRIYSELKDEREQEDEPTLIPELSKGEELSMHQVIPKQHFTQPPPFYTEASLVKALEKNGIGRPSTYAPIVETIQKREYVKLQDKKFTPTNLGVVVTDLLVKYFPDIVDVKFTANIEEELDKIEEGNADWVKVLKAFYDPFHTTLVSVEKLIEKVENVFEETGETCDKCGSPMVIKRGPYGKFLACSGYPNCKNTKPFVEKIGIACPNEGCGGSIIARKTRKGTFYGCDKYPQCDFTSWYKPTDRKCPHCSSIMVLKFSKGGKAYTQCIKDCRKQKGEKQEKEIAAPPAQA